MVTKWETVRIFISSTFEDMHAERDYLVKQVFPELREWCEERKLNLVDIDLRWGVKEDDTQNKSVVEVCLKRIDDARPFFLCFLGQRRGWVPQRVDIAPDTLQAQAFPDLANVIGSSSVTEMEIMHALLQPFHRLRSHKEQNDEYYEPVKYAFFYLRNPSYLDELPEEMPDLRKLYTNESLAPAAQQEADLELSRWREVKIPALAESKGVSVRHYQAGWNADAISPELLLPLACPSLISENKARWRQRWAEAGVKTEAECITDPREIEKANAYNRSRSAGRLVGFRVDGRSLKEAILADLKQAIGQRHPDHQPSGAETELQKELDQQEQFLQVSREGFIARGDDFTLLDQYVDSDSRQVLILSGGAGMGKSTLLANWLENLRLRYENNSQVSIHYRFIGQSDRSSNLHGLLNLLLAEIQNTPGRLIGDIPDDPAQLKQAFPKLLVVAGAQGKTILVLDALNQLDGGLSDLNWLPWALPENIKLVVSVKSGEGEAEALLKRLKGQTLQVQVQPFTSLDDRRRLVKTYLSQYLKDLDDAHIDTLIQVPGAENPLYLKVALSELRVFGAFANLADKIRNDFGTTPQSAFTAVLTRLENDPAYSFLNPNEVVPLMFGLLAHTRHGLSAEELSQLILQVFNLEQQHYEQVLETVYLFLRQVRPFMAHRDGRFDFFYESFHLAARERYQRLYRGQEWHRRLAHYFDGLPLWQDEHRRSPVIRKVAELPYHLAMSENGEDYKTRLLEFPFLLAKVLGMDSASLLEDFKFKTLPGLGLVDSDVEDLSLLERAILLSLGNLAKDPLLLAGQLTARLGDNAHPLLQELLRQAAESHEPWLRPLTYLYQKPEAEQLQSYQASACAVIEVSPAPDGKSLLILSQENPGSAQTPVQYALKRVGTLSGKLIHQMLIDVAGNGLKLVLSPDGKQAVISTSQNLSVFDTETLAIEKNIRVEKEKYGSNSNFIRFSPDGSSVFVVEVHQTDNVGDRRITPNKNDLVQIRLSNGERLQRIEIKGHLKQLVFSASGRQAAICSGYPSRLADPYKANTPLNLTDYIRTNSDGVIQVLDLCSRAAPVVVSRTAICDDLAFTADEGHLVCVSEVGRIELWQVTGGVLVEAHQALMEQIYTSLAAGLLRMRAQGDQLGRARIVTGKGGKRALCSFELSYMAVLNLEIPGHVSISKQVRHPEAVMTLKSVDGEKAASLSPGKELLVWQFNDGALLNRMKNDSLMRDFWPVNIAGKLLVISKNDDGYLRLWDITRASAEAVAQAPGMAAMNQRLYALKRHPRQESISALRGVSLEFIGATSRRRMFELRAMQPLISDFHYHPDGQQMIIVYLDGSVKILSLLNYQTVHQFHLPSNTNAPGQSVLTPDGNWLLWGDQRNQLWMLSLRDGKVFGFETNLRLTESLLPPPADRVNVRSMTPINAPGWGRTVLGILLDEVVLSFCYIPQVRKPYPDHPGTLESTQRWLELHDLRSGKLLQKIRSTEPAPTVLKAKFGGRSGSLYLVNARTAHEYGTPDFSYLLERLDPHSGESKMILARDAAIKDFEISPDESYAVLVLAGGGVEVVALPGGEVLAHFRGDFLFSCCTVIDHGQVICVGDEQGHVNFLQLENVRLKVLPDAEQTAANDTIACDWQYELIPSSDPGLPGR